MERIFFDRIVKLLVTCPHFRGLSMFIDIVNGLEIYYAPYILGIRPHDWERIKKETNLFTEVGQIWRFSWEKAVTSTTTNSKSTNKISLTSCKINNNGSRYRGFSLAFSDTATYPIPATAFDIRFRNFRFKCSHIFTLELSPSSNNNSNSNSSSNINSKSNINVDAEEKEKKLSELFLDSDISHSNKLDIAKTFLSRKRSIDDTSEPKFVNSF